MVLLPSLKKKSPLYLTYAACHYLPFVRISSGQRNLMKTYHNEMKILLAQSQKLH